MQHKSMKHNPSSCSHVGLLSEASHILLSGLLNVHVPVHVGLHGLSQQQVDTENQIVNVVFTVLVLAPQFYVMGRPKSSRYCSKPLLNNLSASIALSFITAGFSVIFTLMDPVPKSLWASYHVFGLLTCGHGLCTAVLTLTAGSCAKTTPELYYMSLFLTVASILSTVFFLVRGGLWLTKKATCDGSQQQQ